MVSLNYTVFIQMVNFLLLILILNVLLYKPILGIIDRRKLLLEEADQEIKRLEATVQQKIAEYERSWREAKLAALEERRVIMAEGAAEAKAIIDAARADLNRMLERFNETLSREVDAAREVPHNRSQKLSLEIAEKILGRRLQ